MWGLRNVQKILAFYSSKKAEPEVPGGAPVPSNLSTHLTFVFTVNM